MKMPLYCKKINKIVLLLVLSLVVVSCATTGEGRQKADQMEPLREPAVLIEHPERFFWELKGETGSVYVLGTIHVADKTFYPLEDTVLQTFDTADRLVSELGGMAELQAFAGVLQQAVLQNMNTDPAKNLLHVLPEADIALLYEKIGDDTVHQLALFNPWILNSVLMQLLMNQSGLNAADGIDMYLIGRAGERNIEGLETAQQQLAVLSFGSFEDQLAILKDTIQTMRDRDQTMEEIDTLRTAYLGNDKKQLEQLLPKWLSAVPASFSAEKAKAYTDALLFNRNTLWAQKFEKYLRMPGTTFVFAGTAHFLGDSSVFSIMRKRGSLK